MKTLVIMGAARKNGHTRQMVDLFLEHLDGEKEIVDAYRRGTAVYGLPFLLEEKGVCD